MNAQTLLRHADRLIDLALDLQNERRFALAERVLDRASELIDEAERIEACP